MKESLNKDGQQFQQYQQKKQSGLTLTHGTHKRSWHMFNQAFCNAIPATIITGCEE